MNSTTAFDHRSHLGYTGSVLWYEALAGALHSGDHAVFDADGTLWEGDVGEALQDALIEEGVLAAAIREEYERLCAIDFGEAYAFATRSLAGLSETWLRDRAARFFAERWTAHVFPEMRGLLTKLGARGVVAWAASSSNRWVVEPGAAALGIPAARVIGMAVEVDDGVLSDRLVLPPVTRAGKAEAVTLHLPAAPALVAGNSVNDLDTLRLATRVALVVNPTPGADPCTGEDLLAEAEVRGWLVRYLF